ncbi:MAG: cobalt-precorrin-5B (C(1))-methyltransferase CbiD [Lachnospiraceae bacterium]|nr:cobalt-precorrin-5B (C(1))-methyltransferase CbiD [Lachnospiraceae bacterium]
MKKGFTTGSCAAAAAKAAVYMLLSGRKKENISIITPAEIVFDTKVCDIVMSPGKVSCAVRKDAGDDPDVTDKTLIYASVSLIENEENEVIIEGGEGVGRVTRPGLDQPVGNAAINSVPRAMIKNEVLEVMRLFDRKEAVCVEISVPDGKQLAEKTFNPRLGIEGGISIIGTSGIVEPMSSEALLATIRLELTQHREEGEKTAVVSPGNYGLSFMKNTFGYDLEKAVKCSNFIGKTIDMAAELGFEKMLICGHMGKLIKLSGGIMNTHSRESDSRMELMAASAIRCGASKEAVEGILNSFTTDEAYAFLEKEGKGRECFSYIMEKTDFYINKRAGENLKVYCIVFSDKWGLLGETKGASLLLKGDV